MTGEEQIKFIHELTTAIAAQMTDAVKAGRVPETWDGHELRQWLCDNATHQASVSLARRGSPNRKRRNDYLTIRIVNDL